jgi:molybdopterin converting factor small subunit
MRVTVKFFSFLQSITGQSRIGIELPEGARLADLTSSLHEQFDPLASVKHQVVTLINHESALPEDVLRDGDEILLLPFLGGG